MPREGRTRGGEGRGGGRGGAGGWNGKRATRQRREGVVQGTISLRFEFPASCSVSRRAARPFLQSNRHAIPAGTNRNTGSRTRCTFDVAALREVESRLRARAYTNTPRSRSNSVTRAAARSVSLSSSVSVHSVERSSTPLACSLRRLHSVAGSSTPSAGHARVRPS